jgi:Bacterial regulatory proteins, tetR family
MNGLVSSNVSGAGSSILATQRQRKARQLETLHRVIAAGRAELDAVGFDELTIRSVAVRAGVAPATAYAYFSSKNHLVVEIFWRSPNERARHESTLPTAVDRICAVFTDSHSCSSKAPPSAGQPHGRCWVRNPTCGVCS